MIKRFISFKARSQVSHQTRLSPVSVKSSTRNSMSSYSGQSAANPTWRNCWQIWTHNHSQNSLTKLLSLSISCSKRNSWNKKCSFRLAKCLIETCLWGRRRPGVRFPCHCESSRSGVRYYIMCRRGRHMCGHFLGVWLLLMKHGSYWICYESWTSNQKMKRRWLNGSSSRTNSAKEAHTQWLRCRRPTETN